MKPWFRSKVVWFNLATLVLMILALPEVTGLIPDAGLRYVVAFQAVVNVLLRFATTEPLRVT